MTSTIGKKELTQIKTNPKEFASKAKIKDLVTILRALSLAYYNKKALVSDDVFDTMKDVLAERDPNNSFLEEIGAKVIDSRERVKLPYYMGSLNKFKADINVKELNKWLAKYPGEYCVSDKMDGESAMLIKTKKSIKLYTRGDGTKGRDISHLLPKLFTQQFLDSLPEIAVRGELIIQKAGFEKFSDTYENSRNMVVGVIGAKTLTAERKKILKLIHYVTYEIINYQNKKLPPCQQFQKLEKLGFEVSKYQVFKKVNNDILKAHLIKRIKKCAYDIDGIVISDNHSYDRYTEKNPKYAMAFKIRKEEDVIEVKVEKIIWQPSVYAKLKPVVKIKPVRLQNANISRITATNARYVRDNKLGIGSIIKITRSGEVIPYIVSVETPAKKPQMPDVKYYWDDNQVDIYLDLDDDSDKAKKYKRIIKQKVITRFFETIGVKYLSEGIVAKLYDAGYKSPLKIIQADRNKIAEIEGLGNTIVTKIYTNIATALSNVTLAKLMVASNTFPQGIAEKRLQLILDTYPDIVLDNSPEKKIMKDILKIKGFSEITANQFVSGLPEFRKFLTNYNQAINLKHVLRPQKKAKITGNKLSGKKIVFTGVRNPDLEKKIVTNGGIVTKSVSSKTSIVIAKNPYNISGKLTRAKQMNIPIMTMDEFSKKYFGK